METTTIEDQVRETDGYTEFLPEIQKHFNAICSENGKYFFTTTATDLFDLFLENIPEEARQHYACNACRHFVNRFGGLVSIRPGGSFDSIMWDSSIVPLFFQAAIEAVEDKVLSSRVNGVFYSNKKEWGFPVTGDWHHMNIIPPTDMVYRRLTQTAGQCSAEKREDFKMLLNCLKKYPEKAIDQAITLLKTESLYRSEKCHGAALWFKQVHENQKKELNSQKRANLIWLAVASAPAGFCHINSSMIGTLLDDIVDGLDFDSISRRFADKMHPLQYQRPQAPPSGGNVAQAEKIIEQLGAVGSLERRFAKLDELQTAWTPKENDKPKGNNGDGVFGHLKTKGNLPKIKPVDMPSVLITWEKFNRTILPDADQISFLVPHDTDSFVAILTAVNIEAPPILQWDSEDKRNPFSWYLYTGGSYASKWGIEPGKMCAVTGICLKPSMWFHDNDHQGKGVVFILNGAKDSRNGRTGNCIFPETLKSEFHSIRSTIEAYSREATLHGYDEASACGIQFCNNSGPKTFEVVSKGLKIKYKIDRWD